MLIRIRFDDRNVVTGNLNNNKKVQHLRHDHYDDSLIVIKSPARDPTTGDQ